MIEKPEEKTFLEIRELLKNLPTTWYPGLLVTMIEESYKQQVWKFGEASDFVRIIEKRMEEEGAV